jgi:MFS transporter, ACS family, DAL5 transporter family protein
MAIVWTLILMASNWRENARRDRVYGVAARDGSDADPRKVLTPQQKATWGLEGLSELEIIELGDRHPGKRMRFFLRQRMNFISTRALIVPFS